MQSRDKNTVHTIMSVAIFALGLVLMIGKIYIDSEPGLIPLVLVTLGAGGYFVARRRSAPKQE